MIDSPFVAFGFFGALFPDDSLAYYGALIHNGSLALLVAVWSCGCALRWIGALALVGSLQSYGALSRQWLARGCRCSHSKWLALLRCDSRRLRLLLCSVGALSPSARSSSTALSHLTAALAFNGFLWRLGSLLCDGTLIPHGSLIEPGTRVVAGSLSMYGAHVRDGSLLARGTLQKIGSLHDFGTLMCCG